MEDGRKCIKKVPVINVITELKLGSLDRREKILMPKVILNQVTGHLNSTNHPSQGPLEAEQQEGVSVHHTQAKAQWRSQD